MVPYVYFRSIIDNALIATEVIHALKRKTLGRRGELTLKIDINKAYDRVDCGFLRGVMTKMGFTDVWIRGDLHGARICRGAPEVSHLLFADDCLLFCRANVDEVNELMRILHVYEQASGQEINLVKSEVFISRNMSHAAKEDLSRILGVKLVLDTGIYLGLPSLVGRSKKTIFSYIKGRIWKRINSWRGRALSKAAFNKAMVAKQVGISSRIRAHWWRIGSGDNIRVMHDPWLRGNAIRWVPSPQPVEDVAERILETPLVSSVREDKVVWEEEKMVLFSESRGCLPTRSRLLERRVECTLNCPVCDEEIEDELHIFFRCAVARDSWCAAGLSSVLHNDAYQQTNAMDRIFALCSNESSDTIGRVAMLLWCIWHNRNDKLWNDNVQLPRQIGRYAFDAWNDWYSVHKLHSNSVSGTTKADLERWEKSALGWVKCNVDVAFVSGSGRTSVRLCFRDNSGQFMAGMTQWQQTVISSVEGEA
ncbi:hypothetical protein TSUD_394290 [Trifolium subterraneum]|uniref:Reverse transcriptase zinc-binding domain-containing protein n=1 Tax=Trifolium subterraneum TaxID=3900 RepID=A0A2Z6MQC5_TRISU|nr:hypothetical protein TSUD_394290 [Trifolium subterraneum]